MLSYENQLLQLEDDFVGPVNRKIDNEGQLQYPSHYVALSSDNSWFYVALCEDMMWHKTTKNMVLCNAWIPRHMVILS